MLFFLRSKTLLTLSKIYVQARKFHHNKPFISFYEKITGITLEDSYLPKLQKKHPNILKLSEEDLQYVLEILKKFDITAEQACNDPHLFSMNPISTDNYGQILKECKFTSIQPKYIIGYHTMVKSKTISGLKGDGILRHDLNLEETLFEYFKDLPKNQIVLNNFEDSKTNIVTVRMSVLEKYLSWKLGVTNEEFKKYCKNYLPLRHRPYEDILESLKIAENEIKFKTDVIRRNGFIISSDPTNTKLLLENVESLAGLNIREVIRLEPAILKNNYQSLLQIKDTLKEYNISEEAQYRCPRVFCMQPKSVRERLQRLKSLKEYPALSTNPRMLSMVVHEKKMMDRLNKIHAAQKQCYSFNLLVSSRKLFNTYLNNFGARVCGNDVGAYINATLDDKRITTSSVLKKLKRHKYWRHTALDQIADNIQMLKKDFTDEVIFNNCHILLYPSPEIEKHINCLTQLRRGDRTMGADYSYGSLDCARLTDNQLLSLALYEMERGYHFSGDGIWSTEGRTQQQDTLVHAS